MGHGHALAKSKKKLEDLEQDFRTLRNDLAKAAKNPESDFSEWVSEEQLKGLFNKLCDIKETLIGKKGGSATSLNNKIKTLETILNSCWDSYHAAVGIRTPHPEAPDPAISIQRSSSESAAESSSGGAGEPDDGHIAQIRAVESDEAYIAAAREEAIDAAKRRLKRAEKDLLDARTKMQIKYAKEDVAEAKKRLLELESNSNYVPEPAETQQQIDEAESSAFNSRMAHWEKAAWRYYTTGNPEGEEEFKKCKEELLDYWSASGTGSSERESLLARVDKETIRFNSTVLAALGQEKAENSIVLDAEQGGKMRDAITMFSQELRNLGVPYESDHAIGIATRNGWNMSPADLKDPDDEGVSDDLLKTFGDMLGNIYTADSLVKDMESRGFPSGEISAAVIALGRSAGIAGCGGRMRTTLPRVVAAGARAGLDVAKPSCRHFLYNVASDIASKHSGNAGSFGDGQLATRHT
ncbi:hypothetical protein ACIRS1_27330 [Kitasatospora sp. NPDC101176]|uniref:hypothetical protein n=1 Tax=Kitasatospora sp. NPDC101176 TaxID=3364099 RepID=UPI0038099BBC